MDEHNKCDTTKLRRLGLQNRIVDDSDFKMSKFDVRILSDAKSDIEIRFQLKDDDEFLIFLIKMWLKLTKFDLFLISFQFNSTNCQLKDDLNVD